MSVTRRHLLQSAVMLAATALLGASVLAAVRSKPCAQTTAATTTPLVPSACRWTMDAELTRLPGYGAQDALCALRGTGRRFQPMQMQLIH